MARRTECAALELSESDREMLTTLSRCPWTSSLAYTEGGVVELPLGRAPTRPRRRKKPPAPDQAPADWPRGVSVTRVRALGRANAGNDLFAGLRSASQLGGIRQQGQYLASHQFLVIRVARPHDGGLR